MNKFLPGAMSPRLFNPNTTVVRYLPSLRAVVQLFRKFSSYDERTQTEVYRNDALRNPDIQSTVWPDLMLGPLSPKDKRFVMPGLVGPHCQFSNINNNYMATTSLVNPEEILLKLDSSRNGLQYMDPIEIEKSLCDISPSDILECVAQTCPTLLRKDFSDLFPDRNIMEGNFTVITISQQTENNMATWSSEVEIEREQLLESFVEGAQEICEALQDAGYWADFIDPSNGKPYLGAHTNNAMSECDDRYRKLGFEIEDLGCCKVITHHKWGTHSYVGCLFTNAPLSHSVLRDMTKQEKNNN